MLFVAAVATLGGYAVLAVDRAVPVRVTRTHLATFSREIAAKAFLYTVAPLGWGQPPPRAEPSPDAPRIPVLLVPGYANTRAALWFLRQFLVRRGWQWVWAVNNHRSGEPIARMAERLGENVQVLLRASGAPQVDIVAHSLGGLVAAWYVRHQGGARHVRRLVTLGTPWKGTKLAVFTRGVSAEELLWGAPVLDDLQPPAVPTVSVWSEDDTTVIPSRSALPVGADGVHIEAAGHTEMLLSARVFRAVHAALGPALPPTGESP